MFGRGARRLLAVPPLSCYRGDAIHRSKVFGS